jgi:RNA polymerase sigma factor (TIGR02999 family)
MEPRESVTALLTAWQRGEKSALARLIPMVYEDLRRMAARCMRRERPDHILQTTALVNEAFLRLNRDHHQTWENRAHFFAFAAQTMRNLLVDHARAQAREKRGGKVVHVEIEEAGFITVAEPVLLLALDDALNRLAKIDPRAGQIVELRYFVGLNNEQIAEVLGVTEKTERRDWNSARAWLEAELRGSPKEPMG